MDRWLLIKVLTVAVVALTALSIVTAVFKLLPTNEEAVHALLFGAWYGGGAGFAIGLYYADKTRRETHGEKNSQNLRELGNPS
jgi:hypothetical protein